MEQDQSTENSSNHATKIHAAGRGFCWWVTLAVVIVLVMTTLLHGLRFFRTSSNEVAFGGRVMGLASNRLGIAIRFFQWD